MPCQSCPGVVNQRDGICPPEAYPSRFTAWVGAWYGASRSRRRASALAIQLLASLVEGTRSVRVSRGACPLPPAGPTLISQGHRPRRRTRHRFGDRWVPKAGNTFAVIAFEMREDGRVGSGRPLGLRRRWSAVVGRGMSSPNDGRVVPAIRGAKPNPAKGTRGEGELSRSSRSAGGSLTCVAISILSASRTRLA